MEDEPELRLSEGGVGSGPEIVIIVLGAIEWRLLVEAPS